MEKEYPIHQILSTDYYNFPALFFLYEKENNAIGHHFLTRRELENPDLAQFTDEESRIVITYDANGREINSKVYIKRIRPEKN